MRPTSDKVREALFSILGARVPGCRFLDLYAGTGAVGIEALSRGAKCVTFVEADPNAVQIMRKNLTACGLLDHADVRLALTQTFLGQRQQRQGPYDVVFADPPYADREAASVVLGSCDSALLASDAVVVIEQDARAAMPVASKVHLVRRYDYGDTALLVFGPAADGPSS